MPYNVAVCRFPGHDQEHPASSGWVTKTATEMSKDSRIDRIIPLRISDTPVDMVRNLMVKTAIKEGADYILFIDSDMNPDIEPDGKPFWKTSWDFLMEMRRRETEYSEEYSKTVDFSRPGAEDVFVNGVRNVFPPATVGAPYCCGGSDQRVLVHYFDKPQGTCVDLTFRLTHYDRVAASRFTGIWEVAALPTGLIIYDARLFKLLPPPWFAYKFSDPPYNTRKDVTEDIWQSRNASLIGLPQYCNWDAWAGHWKLQCVRKPQPLSVDMVPDEIADAVRRGFRGRDKVSMISRQPENRVASEPSALESMLLAELRKNHFPPTII